MASLVRLPSHDLYVVQVQLVVIAVPFTGTYITQEAACHHPLINGLKEL